jgi:hypothetical protein
MRSRVQRYSALRYLKLLIATSIFSASALAQTPDLRPGNFELGLFSGASYGVDQFHVMGGTNLSYSLPKLLLPYVEYSYFPAIPRNFTAGNYMWNVSANISDLHAGVHIRILPHESRFVPYGVVGFGALFSNVSGQKVPTAAFCNSQTTAGFFTSVAGCTSQLTQAEIVKETEPTVNFGIGMRVYHTSHVGYRVEYKIYRPISGQFDTFFQKIEAGVFFQFGGH